RPCLPPSSVPASISLVSAAPTYCRSSANPLPPPYPDNSSVCAISASSNASSAPTATISPALAAPPSLPAAASPNTPSFLLWPDTNLLTTCKHSGRKRLTYLYNFSGVSPDGAGPLAGVIFGQSGELYG